MSEFAEYSPDVPTDPGAASAFTIEEAGPDDFASVARLTAEREHGDPEQFIKSIRNRLANRPHPCRLLVARLDSEVVGFAWTSWSEAGTLPAGWYLSGLIVSPDHRRRGIGRRLTERRIKTLSTQTDAVYYFANLRNRATIDLHAALGFEEVERGIQLPNCNFEGGIGVLYRLRWPT